MIAGLICGFLLVALMAACAGVAFGEGGGEEPTGWFFLVFVVLVGSMFTVALSQESDKSDAACYRQGQIDAANGKLKYVQQRNDDGEVVWAEKKSEDK